MWTAKHLAQASWTELTLPWKDLQWSCWSKVILLHFFDTWAQFPSSKLHKYPNIFKIISSGNGKVWKLTIQCNMVWPFFPHFLHIICGHHGVWWSTFHCWQYEQNSSVAISLIKGITTRTQFSKIFSFNIYHLKWLKLWSSGSFSWCRSEYFFYLQNLICVFVRKWEFLQLELAILKFLNLRIVFLLWHIFMLFTGKKFKGSKRGTGKETTRKLGDSSTRNPSNDRGQHGNANFANEVI